MTDRNPPPYNPAPMTDDNNQNGSSGNDGLDDILKRATADASRERQEIEAKLKAEADDRAEQERADLERRRQDLLEKREDAIRKRQSQLMNQPEMGSMHTSSPDASTERVVPADDLSFGQQRIRLMAAIIALTTIVAISAVVFLPKTKKPIPEEPNVPADQAVPNTTATDVTSTKAEDIAATESDATGDGVETAQTLSDGGPNATETVGKPATTKTRIKRKRSRTGKRPRKQKRPTRRPPRKRIQIDDDDSF